MQGRFRENSYYTVCDGQTYSGEMRIIKYFNSSRKAHSFGKWLGKWILTIILFSPIFINTAFADYIFSAPPREKLERGNEIYSPIAAKLSVLLGEKVVYEQANSWAAYGANMRKGRYDIIFDGPHFNAWRQRHIKHTPIVSLPGTLDFLLVTSKKSTSIKIPRNLVGKKICGMPSPHLATGMIIAEFPSPYLQPEIFEVKGGQIKAYQAFKKGKCDATIFRTVTYKKLTEPERDELKVILETRPLPNQTISISEKLISYRSRIINFFMSKEGSRSASILLARFSQNAMYFEKANSSKFSSAIDLLEGEVYGW